MANASATRLTEVDAQRFGEAPPCGEVVLVDLDSWQSLSQWGAALRRSGVPVRRVVPRRGPLRSALRGVRDVLVMGSWPVTSGPDLAEAFAGLRVRDVHAPEDLTAELAGSEVIVPGSFAGRVPTAAARRVLDDKLAMTRFAQGLGITVPPTWLSPHGHALPLMVKGRSGAGGVAVRRADTAEELDAAVAELDPRGEGRVFFQPVWSDEVVNVAATARAGRVELLASYRATPPPHDRLGPPDGLEVFHCPPAERALATMLAALGYTGVVCADFLVNERGEAALIDFNSRAFGGWLALQRAGVDLLGGYLALMSGAEAPACASLTPGVFLDDRLLPRPVDSLRGAGAEARRCSAALAGSRAFVGTPLVAELAARSALMLARDLAVAAASTVRR